MSELYVWFSIYTILLFLYTASRLMCDNEPTSRCDDGYYIPKIIFRIVIFAISLIVDILFKDAIYVPTITSFLSLSSTYLAYKL